MDCRRIREYLMTDYQDGDLSEKMQETLREHMRICPACSKAARSLSVIRATFKDVGQVPVPAELWEKIKVHIEPKETFWQLWLQEATLGVSSFFHFLHIPRYVLAPVAALAVILAIFTTKSYVDDRNLNRYLGQQAQFMQEADIADLNHLDFLDTI